MLNFFSQNSHQLPYKLRDFFFIKKYLDNLDFFFKTDCKKHWKSHKILSRATCYFFLILDSSGLLQYFAMTSN